MFTLVATAFTTKLQVQVPSKHHNHNLNSDIEDKTARDNDDVAVASDRYSCNRNCDNCPSEPSDSDFGISDDCKLVHDPGGNDINTKDTSTRGDSDSTSTSTSTIISNEPRTADACSFGRDCDKTISSESPSDVDPVLG